MAQGKLKAKTNLPQNVKAKKAGKKGAPITKRSNHPIQPKKKGVTEAKKLKQIIYKTVNKSVEEEIRAHASSDNCKVLSKAQQVVVKHNSKIERPSGHTS